MNLEIIDIGINARSATILSSQTLRLSLPERLHNPENPEQSMDPSQVAEPNTLPQPCISSEEASAALNLLDRTHLHLSDNARFRLGNLSEWVTRRDLENIRNGRGGPRMCEESANANVRRWSLRAYVEYYGVSQGNLQAGWAFPLSRQISVTPYAGVSYNSSNGFSPLLGARANFIAAFDRTSLAPTLSLVFAAENNFIFSPQQSLLSAALLGGAEFGFPFNLSVLGGMHISSDGDITPVVRAGIGLESPSAAPARGTRLDAPMQPSATGVVSVQGTTVRVASHSNFYQDNLLEAHPALLTFSEAGRDLLVHLEFMREGHITRTQLFIPQGESLTYRSPEILNSNSHSFQVRYYFERAIQRVEDDNSSPELYSQDYSPRFYRPSVTRIQELHPYYIGEVTYRPSTFNSTPSPGEHPVGIVALDSSAQNSFVVAK